MNCAQAAKKFADWADMAGKEDMPIKVNCGRTALMREASRSGIALRPRVRGGGAVHRAARGCSAERKGR